MWFIIAGFGYELNTNSLLEIYNEKYRNNIVIGLYATIIMSLVRCIYIYNIRGAQSAIAIDRYSEKSYKFKLGRCVLSEMYREF